MSREERIEIIGPTLDDMKATPLDDVMIHVERQLDLWRDKVRGLDIEAFECLIAFVLLDDGDAYEVSPVQIGKPAAWLVGLSLLLIAAVKDSLKPTPQRKALLAMLEGLATSQSDYLHSVKHGANA